MRTRIAEAAESQDLRPDENHVPIGEARRLFDEEPGAVSGAQITQPELTGALLHPCVQGRHVRVALEANVRVTASDDGLAALEYVRSRNAPFVIQ
jgi:hypothetical protein